MKVENSVSMYLQAFERSYKRQTVTDTKSRNASHMVGSISSRFESGIAGNFLEKSLIFNQVAKRRDS